MPAIDPAFLPVPRDRLAFPTIVVGANDDPYADLLFAPDLARDIGARFIDAGAAGHINVDSGHGPWPEGSLAFAHFLAGL
jgi:predicted alpha/beta hydrolase family esterase